MEEKIMTYTDTITGAMSFTDTFKARNNYNESFEHIAASVNAICDTGKTLEVNSVQPRLTDMSSYSEFGFGAMGRMVGFPAAFVKQLCVESPLLGRNVIADRIDHYFQRGGEDFFIREFGGKICGAVSNKYVYFDDNQVCDIIADSELANLTYKTAYVTPERLHLRAIDFDHPFRIDGDDADATVGIHDIRTVDGQGVAGFLRLKRAGAEHQQQKGNKDFQFHNERWQKFSTRTTVSQK